MGGRIGVDVGKRQGDRNWARPIELLAPDEILHTLPVKYSIKPQGRPGFLAADRFSAKMTAKMAEKSPAFPTPASSPV
jgi:hypothetical protein